MQPPPRKVKVIQELRTVQQEQQLKLHTKHQHETELLEDIREFSQRRAAIEKVYAQTPMPAAMHVPFFAYLQQDVALMYMKRKNGNQQNITVQILSLQKLASQFLQKRDATTPELHEPTGTENRTAIYVWKVLLEETEKVAKARVTAAETVGQQVAESIKLQKNSRAQTLKKCDELTKSWHEEINGTIRELAKAKKNYVEAEQIAQEAREKATEAESKLQRGTLKFFQSKNTLQRQTSKFSQKRSTCDKRAAHMRNEYMLTIAAANVHQQRYYATDLPYVIDTLDGDIFDRLRDYLSVFSTTEIEASTYSMTCSRKVLTNALMVNRGYHHNCFLLQNPIFTNTLQYRFKPIENDKVSTLVIDEHETLYLEREARKWATQVARESNKTEDISAKLDQLKVSADQLKGSDSSSDSGLGQEKSTEDTFDSLREELRKATIAKTKADAKLEVLRSAGINVDQWLESAYEAIKTEKESQKELESPRQPVEPRSRLESTSVAFSSFDDYDEDPKLDSKDNQGAVSTPQPSETVKCVALYTYEAQREDELSIQEHDYLEIVEESEGDGWVKARRENGETGYIPETYVQIQRDHQPVTSMSSQQSDYSITSTPESQSLSDCEVQAVMGNTAAESGKAVVCIVKALYEYSGSSEEELTFPEGAVIKVLRKDENGIDDGYWEGEFNGRHGVFPSILVEEFGSVGATTADEYVEAAVIATESELISVSTAVIISSNFSPALRRVAQKLADKMPAYRTPAKQQATATRHDVFSSQDQSPHRTHDTEDASKMEDVSDNESGPPPEFEPPSIPPPPLPDNISVSSLTLQTDFDPSRFRSSSVGPTESPTVLTVPSWSASLPRSASHTSITEPATLKPARVAPPPPAGKAKKSLQYQRSLSNQSNSQYGNDHPESMV